VERLTPRENFLIRHRELERGVLDEIAPPSTVEEPRSESRERRLHSLLPFERLQHRSAPRARERGPYGNSGHAARPTGTGAGRRWHDSREGGTLPAPATRDVDPGCRRRDVAGAEVAFRREQVVLGLRERRKESGVVVAAQVLQPTELVLRDTPRITR